jgi:hypothetical protein
VVAHDKARGLFFDGPRATGSGGQLLARNIDFDFF